MLNIEKKKEKKNIKHANHIEIVQKVYAKISEAEKDVAQSKCHFHQNNYSNLISFLNLMN